MKKVNKFAKLVGKIIKKDGVSLAVASRRASNQYKRKAPRRRHRRR